MNPTLFQSGSAKTRDDQFGGILRRRRSPSKRIVRPTLIWQSKLLCQFASRKKIVNSRAFGISTMGHATRSLILCAKSHPNVFSNWAYSYCQATDSGRSCSVSDHRAFSKFSRVRERSPRSEEHTSEL